MSEDTSGAGRLRPRPDHLDGLGRGASRALGCRGRDRERREVGKISKRQAEHYRWGRGCDGWHLLRTDGLSVIHERMPPATSEERHLHRVSRQFFFVLSGAVTLETGGQAEVLRAHEGAEVPPGVPHQLLNESEDAAEFMVVSQPPSHGDRLPAPRGLAAPEVGENGRGVNPT